MHPLIMSRPSAVCVLLCPLNNLVHFCCFCAIPSSWECLILFRFNPFLRVTESQLFVCLQSHSKALAVTPLHTPINDTRCWGTVQDYIYSRGVAKLQWHLKVKHMCVYKLWSPSPYIFFRSVLTAAVNFCALRDAMILFKMHSVEFYRSSSLLDLMENFFVMCPPAH